MRVETGAVVGEGGAAGEMMGLGAGEAGRGTVPMHIRFVHIAFATWCGGARYQATDICQTVKAM